ncbi:MAG: DUF1552 domain-containing protein [Planctomycetaceae bacterium]|nr:DUF1552 domain-containing protein [Planctomycetaceae bacterium]
MRRSINRRLFLRSSGIAVALPFLDVMGLRADSSNPSSNPKRMVAICTSLGIHAPFLFPENVEANYLLTPYMQILQEHHRDLTLFSGLSHPDQAGADGHTSEQTWLTSAKNPGLGGFRNTISIDQLVAEKIGVETRFPSLVLGTNHASQSYTRSGVMIPPEVRPSRVFEKLFLDGKPEEVATQMRKIREGRSIMDAVAEEAKRLGSRVSHDDRHKLAEYFQAVREMEQRLALAEEWSRKPKPNPGIAPPQDIDDEKDLIGRMRLLMQLIPLALQTDSTRLITVLVQGRNDVPPIPGVNIDHHNLSHHGQDEAKIQQLKLIEAAEFQAFGELLTGLKQKTEGETTLLDQTMVLFGSNLGNANSHDTRNLPILLAGGGFRHGHYRTFDQKNNIPLCNLFVQMLQHMGLEAESFGSSTSTSVPGFESS